MAAGKLLAFSGPSPVARVYYGFKSFVPEDYWAYFRARGVTAVVRLNKQARTLGGPQHTLGCSRHPSYVCNAQAGDHQVLKDFRTSQEHLSGGGRCGEQRNL